MDAQKIIYMKFSKTKIKLTHLTWWSSLYFELVREGFIGGVGDWKDQIEMFQKSSSDPQTTSSLKVMVYIHIYSGLWIFIESFKTLVLYVCVCTCMHIHTSIKVGSADQVEDISYCGGGNTRILFSGWSPFCNRVGSMLPNAEFLNLIRTVGPYLICRSLL